MQELRQNGAVEKAPPGRVSRKKPLPFNRLCRRLGTRHVLAAGEPVKGAVQDSLAAPKFQAPRIGDFCLGNSTDSRNDRHAGNRWRKRPAMKPTWSNSLAVAAVLGALLAGTTARAADLSFQCTNSASGVSWTVKVDDQKRTVDGAPADISAARISWRDAATGGSYDLDRRSGDLTFINSSSTGGYMLFHRCQLK